MLTLHTFGPGLGEPSLSPFCLKAMILLDMAGLEWAPSWETMPGGPYDKLPWIATPEGVVGDSNLLIDWLERRGAPILPGFDPAARAMARATIRMVEENLRHCLTHDRWLNDACWEVTRPVFFAAMPGPVRAVLPGHFRKKMRKGLLAQGMARFSEADRLAYARADFDALEALLGDGRWLFGAAPSAADASAVPMLSMIDTLPADTALRRALRARPLLMEYIARGRGRLYPQVSASLSAAA